MQAIASELEQLPHSSSTENRGLYHPGTREMAQCNLPTTHQNTKGAAGGTITMTGSPTAGTCPHNRSIDPNWLLPVVRLGAR